MLNIILLILKILGIIILSILGLLLVILLIVLYVPIRYRIKGRKGVDNDDYDASVNVSFLLHIISFNAQYKGELTTGLKIFGIKYRKSDKKTDKKVKESAKKDKIRNTSKESGADLEANKGESIDVSYQIDWNDEELSEETDNKSLDNSSDLETGNQNQSISNNYADDSVEASAPSSIADSVDKSANDSAVDRNKGIENNYSDSASEDVYDAEDEESRLSSIIKYLQKLFEKLASFFDKGAEAVDKLSGKLDELSGKYSKFDRMINDYRNRKAMSFIINQIKYLLVKLMPRKAKGYLHFGFDDPATTGQICMYIGLASPFIPKGIEFEPDFELTSLDGYIDLKGRFALISVLIVLLKLYFNKNVKRLYKMYKGAKK